ncbi:MAG: hypothetical protein KDB27_18250 [Planctomycetales bacterium]|nr:hypothetical protein [Planctomycetales bacterium]
MPRTMRPDGSESATLNRGMALTMRQLHPSCVLLLLAIACTSAARGNLTITTNQLPSVGPGPSFIDGTGSLSSIFDAAAMYWEDLILGSNTIDVRFRWDNTLSSSKLAQTEFFGNAITISIDSTSLWYVDGTPFSHSEFPNSHVDTDGGLTSGVYYTGGPSRFDLLSVSLHEIGHAIHGIGSGMGFDVPQITVTEPLPHAGTIIDTVAGSHLNDSSYPNALMVDGLPAGRRRLISELDLLAVAQTSRRIIQSPADTMSPSIVDVTVSGTQWQSSFLSELDPDRGLGYSLIDTADNLAPLPYKNADLIYVKFSENVLGGNGSLSPDDFAIIGTNTLLDPIAIVSVDYNTVDNVAKLVLGDSLPRDKYFIGVNAGTVTDEAGNELDGGSGAGTDYTLRFNVSPGDFSQSPDGAVGFSDLNALSLAYFSNAGDDNYNVLADGNADGRVNFSDLNTLGLNYFERLPADEPGLPLAVEAILDDNPDGFARSLDADVLAVSMFELGRATSSLTAVPEPSLVLHWGLIALFSGTFRWKRT